MNVKSLITGALLACSLFIGQASAVMIELNVSDNDIQVGETFEVDVNAVDLFGGSVPSNSGFAGFGLNIDIGTGLNLLDVALPGIFVETPSLDPNFVGGLTLNLILPLFPGPIDQLLATLTFEAVSAASTFVGVNSDDTQPGAVEGLSYLNPSVPTILAVSQSTDLLISDSQVSVPAPGLGALFALGLLGVVVRRNS